MLIDVPPSGDVLSRFTTQFESQDDAICIAAAEEYLMRMREIAKEQIKVNAARVICNSPIVNHYLYRPGGFMERIWHPKTGAVFQKKTKALFPLVHSK